MARAQCPSPYRTTQGNRQAFTHGAYHVMGDEDGDGRDDEREGHPPVYSSMTYLASPPPQPAESVIIPRHRLCEGCGRSAGCWHVEGGFDTDTDDEELFMEDPEFDNQMVQAWAAVKTGPQVFNQIAGDLCGSYVLSRSRWMTFMGRLPRRRTIERRGKFANSPHRRDKRK